MRCRRCHGANRLADRSDCVRIPIAPGNPISVNSKCMSDFTIERVQGPTPKRRPIITTRKEPQRLAILCCKPLRSNDTAAKRPSGQVTC